MNEAQKKISITDYKPGKISGSGVVIKKILKRSNSAIVYVCENEEINYEFKQNYEKVDVIISKYDMLREKIPIEIPQELKASYQKILGKCFFNALVSCSHDEGLKHFIEIEKRICDLKTPNQAKSILIFFNLVFCSIFAAIGFTTYFNSVNSIGVIGLCASFGGFGSLFSLLQRNQNVVLNITGALKYTILQGLFISVLGAMSGVIMLLIIKSEIAFSFAGNSISTIALLSILAGFSERLIPDVFSKIESNTSS